MCKLPSRRAAKPNLFKLFNSHSPSFQIFLILYGSSCKATDGKQKNSCEPHRHQTRMMKD